MQGLLVASRVAKALIAGPLEQPVQEGAWPRSSGEGVNTNTGRRVLLVVLLLQVGLQRSGRLRRNRRVGAHPRTVVGDCQSGVAGDPPVRCQRVQRAQGLA